MAKVPGPEPYHWAEVTDMTRQQALREFRETVMPAIRRREEENGFGASADKPMRREEWSNHVDALQKAGRVTRHQADTWSNPF